ncbi:hypothetical protein L596_028594 [Steinernema carpocapsae]|uniref:Uncharacterized protein n=1 Tax=Steinernema carpocapsae TaxID=34508 RepID=A0A4U5LYW3_STECR|nr:hypothetical protein L596_028594 [Steinernema carpocapsae]
MNSKTFFLFFIISAVVIGLIQAGRELESEDVNSDLGICCRNKPGCDTYCKSTRKCLGGSCDNRRGCFQGCKCYGC